MVNIAIMIAIFILGCLITIVALALVRGTKEVEQTLEKPTIVEDTIVEEPKPIKKKRVYKPRKPKQTEK
jgi:hypothetical protein